MYLAGSCETRGIIMIYVIVLVTYDHYRFQENLGAGTDKVKVMERARELCAKTGLAERLKIVSYTKNGKIADRYRQINHIWIQTMME